MKNWLLKSLLFLIPLVVYHAWIIGKGIITSGDWPYALPSSVIDHYLGFGSLWRTTFSLGGVVLDIGQGPSYYIYGLLTKYLGIDYQVSEKIVHLFPIAFGTLIFSYLFLFKIFKKIIPALVGSFIYAYNTYILILQTGHQTLAAAYALAPLALYCFIELLEKSNIKKIILTALVFFVTSSYEPRLFFIIFFILLFYLAYKVLITQILKVRLELIFIASKSFIILSF